MEFHGFSGIFSFENLHLVLWFSSQPRLAPTKHRRLRWKMEPGLRPQTTARKELILRPCSLSSLGCGPRFGDMTRKCVGWKRLYTGWWYTYPSEKYEIQLGWWHSQYMGKMFQTTNQCMVQCLPNHGGSRGYPVKHPLKRIELKNHLKSRIFTAPFWWVSHLTNSFGTQPVYGWFNTVIWYRMVTPVISWFITL